MQFDEGDLAGCEIEDGIRSRFELQTAESTRIVNARSVLNVVSATVSVAMKDISVLSGVNQATKFVLVIPMSHPN